MRFFSPIHLPRRKAIPTLLAVLAVSVFLSDAWASHGPTPTTRPATVTHGTTPASAPGPRSTAPGTGGIVPEKNDPEIIQVPTPAEQNPVKITLAPIPFETIRPTDFIVREVIVQNDSPDPANVEIFLRFSDRYYSKVISRTVRTARQVPANTRQTIPVFVPAAIPPETLGDSDYFNSADPKIYLNGRPYRIDSAMSGFLTGVHVDNKFLPLPSSFSNQEEMAKALDILIGGREHWPLFTDSLWRFSSVETGISGSDTIQWPSIPQFYQSKHILFRKSTDAFTPDAERAIHDAVMLGATEVLLVMPGSPWPDWAPRPASRGLPVIVARGLGQSVVIDAANLHLPSEPMELRLRTEDDDDDYEEYDEEENGKWFDMYGSRRDRNEFNAFSAANPALVHMLQNTRIWTPNPSRIILTLPHISVPAIPFFLILLALLGYIVIVGPVNYFFLIRKKKRSVLMLLTTVPLISLIFMVVVIVFVTVVEGWSSRASAVGVTFLDQQGNMAYTRAAVSLYAPVPVSRMVFDTADSVTFSSTRDINVSLGREQIITGANRARIPLAYAISRAEKRFEQLKITESPDGVSVMNGLGAPLKSFLLKTDRGEVWTADRTVEPGESVRLVRFDGRLLSAPEIDRIVGDNGQKPKRMAPTSPERAHLPESNPLLLTASALLLEMEPDMGDGERIKMISDSRYGAGSEAFNNNLYSIRELYEDRNFLASVLPAGIYMAETDRALFYTPGCKPVSFRARHIVFGTFNAQEATSNEN